MSARLRSGTLWLALLAVVMSSSVLYWREPQAHPGPEVDIDIFYDALAPYGNWVHHDTYGRVWYPRGVSRGWRPYTEGHWAHTLEYGWVWVSDWVWGWAPFHYGRWTWDNWHGWFWVPGRIWAPAWVFWRHGGGYAAWAPMPPHVIWKPGAGLVTDYFDFDRDMHSDCWIAVREHDLAQRHMRRHIIEPHQIMPIIRVTRPMHPARFATHTFINRGVPVSRVERITGTPIAPVHLKELERIDHRGNGLDQEILRIIRPNIKRASPEETRRDEERAARFVLERSARPQTLQTAPIAPSSVEKSEPGLPERWIENRFSRDPSPPRRLAPPHAARPKSGPPLPQAPKSSATDPDRPMTSGPSEPESVNETKRGIRQPPMERFRRSPVSRPSVIGQQPQPERPEMFSPPVGKAPLTGRTHAAPMPEESARERWHPRPPESARAGMDKTLRQRPMEQPGQQTEKRPPEQEDVHPQRRWQPQSTTRRESMPYQRQIESEMQRQRSENPLRAGEKSLRQRQWQQLERAQPEQFLRPQGPIQRQQPERTRGETLRQRPQMPAERPATGGRQAMEPRRP